MVNYDVPFVGNTSDDIHCLQASYDMIRRYFEPMREIAWSDWLNYTGFVPGIGTWSNAGLMWFRENGYDVAHIGLFDYEQFSQKGTNYLIESLGEDLGRWEAQFIQDVEFEKGRTQRFLDMDIWERRQPMLSDIYSYLDDGYLVKCVVNLNALNGESGYVGHAVVVKGYTADELILNDPGLPAIANRHVPIDLFEQAWGGTSPSSSKLDAIRLHSPMASVLDANLSPDTSGDPVVALA